MVNTPHTQQPAYSLVGLACHEVLLFLLSNPLLLSGNHDTPDLALDVGAVCTVSKMHRMIQLKIVYLVT